MKEQVKLLSIPEFAAALNVTPACVRRWILLRKISFVKIGRLIRITMSEQERVIAEGTVHAREQQ